MDQELTTRLTVFKFLLETGYTFENALRAMKRPQNPIPEQVQTNFDLLFRTMADEAVGERSAIDIIKAGETGYRKVKEEEQQRRRKEENNHFATVLFH